MNDQSFFPEGWLLNPHFQPVREDEISGEGGGGGPGISLPVSIANGGTGAGNAAQALSNLGVPSFVASQLVNYVTTTALSTTLAGYATTGALAAVSASIPAAVQAELGNWVPWGIADGGTGATTPAGARAALGAAALWRGASAPDPAQYPFWWDPGSAQLFVWDSAQWVVAANPPGTGGGGGSSPGTGGIDYSTTEQDTGLKWVDGSAVYQKTIAVSANTGSLPAYFPHGITGLASIISITGSLLLAVGSAWISLPHADIGAMFFLTPSVDGASLALSGAVSGLGGSTSFTGNVTLQYTKA